MASETARALTISSGTGTVKLGSTTTHIGTTNAIGNLTINAEAGTGEITLRGSIGAGEAAGAAVVTIGNASGTATDLLDFDGTAYNSSGASSYSGESITLSGADPNFITDGSDVKFSDGTITLELLQI